MNNSVLVLSLVFSIGAFKVLAKEEKKLVSLYWGYDFKNFLPAQKRATTRPDCYFRVDKGEALSVKELEGLAKSFIQQRTKSVKVYYWPLAPKVNRGIMLLMTSDGLPWKLNEFIEELEGKGVKVTIDKSFDAKVQYKPSVHAQKLKGLAK